MDHKPQPAKITYTNWKGETATRLVMPMHVWFGTSQWHPEPQWFLSAWDVAKDAVRDFAMSDITKWEKP